jgi:molybdenum cofactor cytidylyltransferase
MSVAAIILAAGSSSRLGQPKQLLRLDGETLLARMIRLAKEAGAAPVIAVVGAHCNAICKAVDFGESTVIVNGEWEKGISTSIRAGLRALEQSAPDINAALLMTCDQPRLTTGHLRTLMEAFAEKADSAIVASAYGGIQGVPAIFPRVTFPTLSKLRGDKGARALLAQPPMPVISVPFEGGEIDIDLPRDIEQFG